MEVGKLLTTSSSPMSFLQSLSNRFPLPSASEMEAAHFDALAPFPELDQENEKLTLPFFSWSPKAINEKRQQLLGRPSLDVESQASTDASTLLETEEPKRRLGARVVSDAIIGLSDGLTVPFALTAGLSALGNTKVVIFAGLAELTAGAISMGLGGYLGAKSEE